MKNYLSLIFVTLTFFALLDASEKKVEKTKNFHSFKMKNIDGKETSLSDYKGKAVLIVNVASKCGLTPQYKNLVTLDKKFDDKQFVILGFPANDFRKQEPGSDKEIKAFCTKNYEVGFSLFSKISVKGADQHPLYSYLTKAENPDFKGDIRWNFEKILVDSKGDVVRRFHPKVLPDSDEMVKAIELLIKVKK